MLPNTHEVRWRKSSHSGGEGGQCVELGVADLVGLLVRDSKNARGPVLAADWRPLVTALIEGKLSR